MHREIMFRAWDKDSSKMFYSENNNIEEMYFNFHNREIQLLCPVDEDYPEIRDCEIMQFTGLKDKNGLDICEGDIYHQGDENIKYEVVWHDAGLIGKQINTSSYAGLEHWKERIEVIGNKYENPELLK